MVAAATSALVSLSRTLPVNENIACPDDEDGPMASSFFSPHDHAQTSATDRMS
jgi:hypothetical protein